MKEGFIHPNGFFTGYAVSVKECDIALPTFGFMWASVDIWVNVHSNGQKYVMLLDVVAAKHTPINNNIAKVDYLHRLIKIGASALGDDFLIIL